MQPGIDRGQHVPGSSEERHQCGPEAECVDLNRRHSCLRRVRHSDASGLGPGIDIIDKVFSRHGVEYEVANGESIVNLGERMSSNDRGQHDPPSGSLSKSPMSIRRCCQSQRARIGDLTATSARRAGACETAQPVK